MITTRNTQTAALTLLVVAMFAAGGCQTHTATNAAPATLTEAEASAVTLLFVQNAQGVTYDQSQSTLTLEGVSPAATYFSDRPHRIAGHITLPGFVQLWDEGADSFQADPPNANLSIIETGQVRSAVIEIANPRLNGDRMTYDVVQVLSGDVPEFGGTCSLFIDGLFDGAPLGGSGFRGAAGGAIIGAIAGDAGKGAAIGAGVGILGGAIRQGQEQQAAQQAALTTRVVNVPNANGSYTPVTLHLTNNGWQGPRGEIYPTLPTVSQLSSAYGVR